MSFSPVVVVNPDGVRFQYVQRVREILESIKLVVFTTPQRWRVSPGQAKATISLISQNSRKADKSVMLLAQHLQPYFLTTPPFCRSVTLPLPPPDAPAAEEAPPPLDPAVLPRLVGVGFFT